jgi:hypothetical protein
MMNASVLEAVLRRDRAIIIAAISLAHGTCLGRSRLARRRICLPARQNGFNAEMLAYLILAPHPRMNLTFTREEAEDLAAYIASLREAASHRRDSGTAARWSRP